MKNRGISFWGDLSFFQRGPDHYHAMVKICELFHCGFMIWALHLRLSRGDMPLLNVLLQNDFLPTSSLTKLNLIVEWNATIPVFMYPYVEKGEGCEDTTRHPLTRFLLTRLLEHNGSTIRSDQPFQKNFGMIQTIHSTIAAKCPNLNELRTVFVWDSRCWDERRIQEFVSLRQLNSLHLTLVPEVTLRRGNIDSQGIPISTGHSDTKMLRILERILSSFPCLETLILRSNPSLYGQIVVENTISDSWHFQSNSLTYLDVISLDACYFFRNADCPKLEEFRLKQRKWNEVTPSCLDADEITNSMHTKQFQSPDGGRFFTMDIPEECAIEGFL
jgi:hypothetical protein